MAKMSNAEAMLNRIQSASRYASLDTDKTVQKRWKHYLKRTKGASRMNKSQWYDFNYPKRTGRNPKGLTDYAARSRRMSGAVGGG